MWVFGLQVLVPGISDQVIFTSFDRILVDEYQDTNKPQYILCRQLSAHHRNICVAGDDDQSIYQFRGADIRNILDFERDYPDAHTVRLEQNYRSTARILAAANAVIDHNQDRKGKKLWTEGPDGDPVAVVECDTDRREARHIVDQIRRQTSVGPYGLSDAAILYRTNAQSRPLEEELQRSGLPYIIVGGIRFYDRKEIKGLLSYLRVLVNPVDDITLRRIVNTHRRCIGDTSLERLQIFDAASRSKHHLCRFRCKLAACIGCTSLHDQRPALYRPRDIERATHIEELTLMIECVQPIRIKEDTAVLVANEGVVGPAVPEPGDHVEKFPRPAVAVVMFHLVRHAKIKRRVRVGRRHQVPTSAPTTDMV